MLANKGTAWLKDLDGLFGPQRVKIILCFQIIKDNFRWVKGVEKEYIIIRHKKV
jgi:hypothetical protein